MAEEQSGPGRTVSTGFEVNSLMELLHPEIRDPLEWYGLQGPGIELEDIRVPETHAFDPRSLGLPEEVLRKALRGR